MTYTVVGETIYANATTGSTATITLSLPTGTQVGDMLFMAAPVEGWYDCADSRLVEIASGGGAQIAFFGGVADSLGDIDIDVANANAPRHLYLIAVRGPSNVQRYVQWDSISDSVMADDYPTPLPMDFGLCFTQDASSLITPTLGTDPDGDWTALTLSSLTYTNGFGTFDEVLRGYYLPGHLPVPYELWLGGTQGTDYERRISRNVFFTTIGRAFYLRQRQSPVRTPSRIRGTDLRQKQTPSIR